MESGKNKASVKAKKRNIVVKAKHYWRRKDDRIIKEKRNREKKHSEEDKLRNDGKKTLKWSVKRFVERPEVLARKKSRDLMKLSC